MTPKALLDEILRLPVEERLSLLEQVWDSVAADPAKVPVPAWHIEELDRRLADPNPERLSWDELKSRFFDRK
jgi:putative addiction module component (TIGR02574 family)